MKHQGSSNSERFLGMQLLAVITLTVIMIASWQGVIHRAEAMAASEATATPTNTKLPQEIKVVVITPATPTPIPTVDPMARDLHGQLFSGTPFSTEEWLALQATDTALTNKARRLLQVTSTPAVPPMDQIFTPMPTATPWPVGIPTPTIDPNDPLRLNSFHLRVMDSMNSVRFTILPVERDKSRNEWIFKWRQAWAPPVLESKVRALPGGSPYMFRIQFVIRPYPFDALGRVIERHSLNDRNEIRLSDLDLIPTGKWAFAVRGDFTSLEVKETSPWSDWYIVDIQR